MELIKLTRDEFACLAKLVYDQAGIHLPESKMSLLSNRLRRRLRALGLDSFRAYYEMLRDPAGYDAELPHFLSAVTTNETYFFRNELLWRFFREEWIPQIAERKKGGAKSIRLWSAASSSGEEAYTAAICLEEALPRAAGWNIQIIGTDISPKVLKQAEAGVYNAYAVARTDKKTVSRWFDQEDDSFVLKQKVRDLVTFRPHNLRDPQRDGKFDFVFLRNVLMYFDLEMKKRVLKHVVDAVLPGGHLVIGDVDPVRSSKELSAMMTMEYEGPNRYYKPERVLAAARAK